MSNHYIHGFNLGSRLEKPGMPGDHRILRRLPKITEIFMALRKGNPVRLGILDTETTGLDPAGAELIEIAITTMTINEDGSLHDLAQPKSWREQPSLPLEPKIIQVTGLTDADLAGQRFDDEAITEQISQCHVLVSHNARFDRAFLSARYGELVDKPWGCTAADMDWLAHGLGGRSLGHLLYEAGYFYEAHRAGPDSWALACLLAGKAGDGRIYAAHLLDAVRRPAHRIYARRAPYAVKDRLKARGYRWHPQQRCWWIDVQLEFVEAEREWLALRSHDIVPDIEKVTAYERHS